MLNVAAFTGGKYASPARFRVRQYKEYLLRFHQIRINEYPAPLGSWPPHRHWLRPAWGAATLVSRLPAIVRSYSSDVTLLQQSMVSTFVTLEGVTARPRVLDIDDALWAYSKRENFVPRLVALCDSVICGNNFLAEYVSSWNRKVVVIPTGVDTEYFIPGRNRKHRGLLIGWSGGSGGFRYLYDIEPALKVVLEKYSEVRLLVTSNRRPEFSLLPPERVLFVPWSPENEVRIIQDMDIGIMPIDNSVAARGKCSFKMLLYMACGKPVVVSSFGMNREVLGHGQVGFGVRTMDEWVDSLSFLLNDVTLREGMGSKGRRVVQEQYSLSCTGKQLAIHLASYG